MSNGSNIAVAINAARASVEQAKREGVRHVIECGRLLQQARRRSPTANGTRGCRTTVRSRCAPPSFI